VRGLLRKVGLSLVALALAGAYVLSGGDVAHADPTTVDGARAQLAQLEQQQSELDAKYTEVQVKLQDSQKTLDEARSDSAAQQTKERTGPREFLHEVRGEMRKVAWPTKKEIINSTIIVLIAVVVMTTLIFLFDYASAKFVLFLYD